MFCSNCGSSNVENSMFCQNCGTKLTSDNATQNLVQTNVKDTGVAPVQKNRNNKSTIIILSIFAAIVSIGLLSVGFISYKSRNVSKSVIKNDFMGYSVKVGSLDIEVSKDNLKSIKLKDKKREADFGIRTFSSNGTIVLETKKYKLELPMSVSYAYYPKLGGWCLDSRKIDNNSENIVFEIKEKVSEDVVKAALIGSEMNDTIITEDIVKGLKVNSIEEDTYGWVNAYSTIENKEKFVTKTAQLRTAIKFDGEKWVCNEYGSHVEEEKLIISEPSGDLSIDEIKKNILMVIGSKKFKGYKNYMNIDISLDEMNSIKNLNVDSINGSSYIITGSAEGESNGFNFNGNIKITVSEKGTVECSIELEKISLDKPTEDVIKTSIGGQKLKVWIDKKSSSHLITDKDKENVKINEIFDDKDNEFIKHVYMNMSYTEQGKNITSDLIYIKMQYYPILGTWDIDQIVSSTDTSFTRYYSKDVINKKN